MIRKFPFFFVLCLLINHVLIASGKHGSNRTKKTNYHTKNKILENTSKISWNSIRLLYPVSSEILRDRNEAFASFKKIEEEASWVDNFSNEDIKELPVGVKHTRENIQYAIGITRANIYKDYTELTVFARVRLPQTNENGLPVELFFGANNVKLSHQGGIIGDANLVLLGDMRIPFNGGKWMLTLKGGFDYRTGITQNSTYVTINCEGVKELGIEGEVEFSRELILPLEKNGEVDEKREKVFSRIETENGTQNIQVPYRVKGAFRAIASDWNDLLVGVDLQPFVLAKKRNNENYDGNFQFYVNEAVLDFSDLRNAPNVSFPDHYRENGLLFPNQNSWRGVYVNTLEVKLPKEFKTSETISEGNKRIAFGAHHLLIDGYGISGSFYAKDVFSLDKGRTNKEKAWAYSLDRIEVSLVANKLVGASFNGRIQLPISTSTDKSNRLGLAYTGIISEEEYLLNVRNASVIDFNLWKAKGKLLPNSVVELKVKNGEFQPKAILHGNLTIKTDKDEEKLGEDFSNKKTLIDFKGIVFENLVLQTKGPVFSVDYMGYTEKVALADFPVSIEKIGITANKANANLYFDLAINLMGKSNGFGAKTSLGIIGAFEEENYRQKWKFKEINLAAISMNADLGGFSMEGSLALMNNDPEYGNGFAANLQVEFKSGEGIKVAAKGVFGKTTFRYWQFEAMVDNLPPGAGSGVLNLEGFAGGASYRMKRTDFSSSFSPSGIGYVPDEKVGLGVKAMVMFNAVKKEIIKGGAGFEIVFNRNGGIDFLGFYGQATLMGVTIPGVDKVSGLMSKLKKNTLARKKFLGVTEENIDSAWMGRNLLNKASRDFPQTPAKEMDISAKVAITYDFQNDVLHGELDAFINVAGGFIKGRGARGRAGWAVLHFSPEEWYIYIGTPEDRLGLRIGVGPVSIESGGYFMTGTKLPAAPPPPRIVSEILGVSANELDYMRNENTLANGGGFAFGSDISVDTGDLRFLIFYARFQAGTGFDIMLKDYGEAQCSNTGSQVGINGWYANGQAYTYLQGELGIHVKLFFVNKKISIIKGGAAALLQVKAPNPVWMRGYIGGHFSLLGGMIKGRFRFKLILGEECVFENASPLGGLKIITDVSPDDGEQDIDVFAIPQATFSMKVGEPIVIPEDEGDKTYKIVLEKFKILHKGKEIPGKIEWANYKDKANFVSTDILPPNEEVTVQVTVSFMERVGGIYKTIIIDGKKAIEKEERTFTTGGAPTVIPLHNITYAYPVLDQKYFLEKEYNKGYIQLKRGQDYLFDNAQWNSYITYKEEGMDSSEHAFKYNTSDNMLTYQLPNVSQSKKYRLSITSKPIKKNTTKNVHKNSYTKENIGDSSNENSVQIQQKSAENISKEGEIERLAYSFTTSKYKTFRQKIKSIKTTNYNWGKIYSDVIYLTNRMETHEPFDIPELLGTKFTNNISLVKIEASLEDAYFIKDINPPLYAKYPTGGYTIKNRDTRILGTPPKFALPLLNNYITSLEHEVNDNMLQTTFPFRYNLGLLYKKDWVDLQSQIANDYADGIIRGENPILNFLDRSYLFMRYGYYKAKLFYTLPGNIKGSNVEYKFKNPNNFR
ncbi:hypothetical protein [Tenacibaculum maritimum]|uniref:hypothetical protein n=1 Tax=Tenacibaculum maritimum TaxID=107401 RepID=UPI0012E52BEC|nr:hypothetical protein [Tenacibaculum maritimum]CAA0203089.1 conserved exported hypothetical protein [Tenacibaculum maritimum]